MFEKQENILVISSCFVTVFTSISILNLNSLLELNGNFVCNTGYIQSTKIAGVVEKSF